MTDIPRGEQPAPAPLPTPDPGTRIKVADGWSPFDTACMERALELAALGRGLVEPNPMVGCVLARDGRIVGEGWHRRFGGPHAEVEALAAFAGVPSEGLRPEQLRAMSPGCARGLTAYVSLEPCCHHGKTPPCTDALVHAGVARVVSAMRDPFPQVDGGGERVLRAAGIGIRTGLLADRAARLNAPFLSMILRKRPWVIAKWAQSLDGKIAAAGGDSRWISGAASRARVHRLRARVDAIVVGSGTVLADDPMLTARLPPDPATGGPMKPLRVATRVVVDRRLRTPLTSRLVTTAREVPLIVVVSPDRSGTEKWRAFGEAGVRPLAVEDPDTLLTNFRMLRMTNVLVEGGATLLTDWLTRRLVDEVHVYTAPVLIGGAGAPTAWGGIGAAQMSDAIRPTDVEVHRIGDDALTVARLSDPVRWLQRG